MQSMRSIWLIVCGALLAGPAIGQEGGDPLPELRKRAEAMRGTQRELSVLASLYNAERNAGNHGRAAQIREQIFAHPGPNAGARLTVHFHDAAYLAANADPKAARVQWDAGAAILAGLDPQRPPLTAYGPRYRARQDWALAAILRGEGRIADAQAALDRALANNAEDIHRFREGVGRTAPTAERDLAVAEGERANLRSELISMNIAAARIGAAELVTLDWIRDARAAGKPRQLTSALKRHGDVLLAAGRYSHALARFDEVLVRQQESGLDATSVPGIRTRRSRAQALMGLGRWADAYAAFRDMEAATKRSRAAREVLRGGIDRALVRVMTDRAIEAERIIDGAIATNTANYGAEHRNTLLAEGVRGLALAHSGRDELALPLFRRYVASWGYLLASADPALEESALLQLRHRAILEGYLALLARRSTGDAGMLDEGFRVADALRAGHVQQAVAAAAARATIADPALAALVREDQDLGHVAAGLYRALGGAGEQTEEEEAGEEPQAGDAATGVRQRLREIEARRALLQSSIRSRHPDYAQLVRPTPPAPPDIAPLLAAGEALLSITPTAGATYVFALTPDGRARLHVATVGEAWLAERVRRMRAALDVGDTPLERLAAFDVAAAHELYAALLAPLRDSWSPARHLIVSVSGSLAQIPFALLAERPGLPAAAATPFAEYAEVPWLARHHAISHVPAAAVLQALRRLPAARGARQPFVGFGDPDFGGPWKQATGALRSVRRGSDGRIEPEATLLTAYRALAPLPDTREEILALARTLGAASGASFLGAAASRDAVLSSSLRHKAIVAFATHGLQPGDLPGLDQPALAMSLPSNAAASPLLTLADVLGLKLDADWVVLSACNTAGADSEAAEALSGLGRGFFFAGARAILLTHWPVESESARRLVSTAFARYAADPKLARAEALRAAQLELMGGKGPGYSLAHPLFWAPYALIGDGGR